MSWVACGSCYHLPTWKGEVNVTPRERESIKKCGNGALTDAGKTTLTREPYVQGTTTTSTSIVWGTRSTKGHVVLSEPDGKDVVAKADAVYAGDANKKAQRVAAQAGLTVSPEDIYVVRADLAKLEATHLYCYQVFSGDVALTEPAPLATAAVPSAKEKFRFIALGDTGTGDAAQVAIGRWIAAQPFDFMLFLGDIAYKSGTPSQLQHNFFDVYRDILRFVPAYPAIGNHERRTREGRPYFEAFVLPEPERYYSFDWGNVHFVAIDTTQRDAKQLIWLDEDLKSNKLPWVIVFGHHPMYTNSLRGPQQWIRGAFSKILTDNKVDLVLTGHEHQYERFRINDVNYIVSGGGGGQLTRFYGASEALKQFTVHHFLAFEVGAEKLEMRVIDISGNELEKLELTKEPKDDKAKVKVDDKPTTEQNPVAPEDKVVP
ncbi:MAG: metallophosphoesterase, partial [Deltaproteobacteria bacterium]|nr:metallophosphoesterase [Deltaproteobacteria bacterium]